MDKWIEIAQKLRSDELTITIILLLIILPMSFFFAPQGIVSAFGFDQNSTSQRQYMTVGLAAGIILPLTQIVLWVGGRILRSLSGKRRDRDEQTLKRDQVKGLSEDARGILVEIAKLYPDSSYVTDEDLGKYMPAVRELMNQDLIWRGDNGPYVQKWQLTATHQGHQLVLWWKSDSADHR